MTGVRRYWLIWAAVIPVALWALIRSFGLESGGQLTSLMWFTPYAANAALLVAGVALALRNWAAAAVAAVAMSSLAISVELGGANPNALIALVDRYHPDLLSVQELTPSLARKLRGTGSTAGSRTRC